MRLKRLIVHGFKSFKDRTTINFDDGITGIVGPNGCGKSNIVDALFWVMGEQSAKHLRGSSMQDLIFSGSQKYAQAGWAEVTLVLDNPEEKHIHVGKEILSPSEIQLTRKLYKNHETEYRINNRICRLKDIQEVFMDTGAGAKSYSVIAQGEIDRLVQAKPEERRAMIEEVAGVTKFKRRRRESLKKIEHTMANIERISDIKQEIHRSLKSLEKQAAKAERAKYLKEKVKKYEVSLAAHKEYSALKGFRDCRLNLIEQTAKQSEAQLQKDQYKLSLERLKLQQAEHVEQVDQLQAEYNQWSKVTVAKEEKRNYLQKSLDEKSHFVDSRNEEVESAQADLESRKERLEELNRQKAELEQASVSNSLESIQEKLSELAGREESKKGELTQQQTVLNQLKEQADTLAKELMRNGAIIEEKTQSLTDINAEILDLEERSSSVSKEVIGNRAELDEREAQFNKQTKIVEDKTEELRKLGEKREKQRKKLEELSKEEVSLKSKSQALKEFNETVERKINSVTAVLKDLQDGNAKLSDIVQWEEQYEKHIIELLGDKLGALVTKNKSGLQQIQEWVASRKNTEISVLCEGSGETSDIGEALAQLDLGEVTPLSHAIKCTDEGFDQVLKNLFHGFYIVEKLDADVIASLPSLAGLKGLIGKDMNYKLLREGGLDVVNVGKKSSEYEGILERKRQIEEFEKRLDDLHPEIEGLMTEVAELQDQKTEVESDLSELRDELNENRETFFDLRSKLEARLAQCEQSESRLEILKKRKTVFSEARLESLEKEENLKKKEEELNTELAQSQDLTKGLDTALQELLKETSLEKEALLEQKLVIESFEERSSALESQLQDTNQQIGKLEKQIESGKEFVAKMNQEMEENRQEKAQLDDQIKVELEKLNDCDERLKASKAQLQEIQDEMSTVDIQERQLGTKLSKYEKNIVEFELKIERFLEEEEHLVRDIFEKHRIDLRRVIGAFLEISSEDLTELRDVSSIFIQETESGETTITPEDFTFVKKSPKEVSDIQRRFKGYKSELNRIGDVNWQAVSDYERQKIRYDFLRDEDEALRNSVKDLEIAIEHIDEKCRNRFNQAFSDVSEKFERVFPIIFGGGSAKLSVVGDINGPECGVEIHAQPPGKKMQNINLMSGGEKAMTALSLIFSIFLVKPSPFCLLDEVDAPLDDANVGRFNDLLREMSSQSQFVLITHNKKTMELNDTLYGITMQEPGISTALSVQLQ